MSSSEPRESEGVSAAAPDPGRDEWVIRPRRANLLTLFGEVWDYRALVSFIIVQSVLQIYRKMVLGIVWLVIRPAIAVTVSVLVVGQVLGISTDPVPLLVFTVAGFVLWTLFQRGLRHGTKSLTRASSLIRRVNFPRILVVGGALAPGLIEAAVVFVGAAGVMVAFASSGIFTPSLGWPLLAMAPALVMVMLLVVGLASVTSVLNTIVPDTSIVMNYVAAAIFFVTPVAYPLSAVPESWRGIIALNPLTPAMELWRWAALGTPPPTAAALAIGAATIFVILLIGLTFFMQYERAALDRS